MQPGDAIKDPYVLEFLDLKDEYSESDLEAALIQRLEDFLLELGDTAAPLQECRRVGFADEVHRRLAEPPLEHGGKRAGAVVAQIQRHLRDGLPGR